MAGPRENSRSAGTRRRAQAGASLVASGIALFAPWACGRTSTSPGAGGDQDASIPVDSSMGADVATEGADQDAWTPVDSSVGADVAGGDASADGSTDGLSDSAEDTTGEASDADSSPAATGDADAGLDAAGDGPGNAADADAEGSNGCVTWSKVPGSPGGTAISGSGPTDIWVVTNHGIMRGDGVSWSLMDIATTPPSSPPCVIGPEWPASMTALWVAGPNEVFFAACYDSNGQGDSGRIFRWDGSTWNEIHAGGDRQINSLWGSGPDDVWGSETTAGYLGHWEAGSWSDLTDLVSGRLGGGAPSDFWLSGYSLVHHTPSGTFATSDLTALGFDGGGCLSTNPPSGLCFYAIWASSTSDVWVSATGRNMLHFDGASWTLVSTPASATIRGIWGSSRSDVWAVGDMGTVLHFDGSRWSSVVIPTTADLASVWSSGPCDVWAIGDAVYHGGP